MLAKVTRQNSPVKIVPSKQPRQNSPVKNANDKAVPQWLTSSMLQVMCPFQQKYYRYFKVVVLTQNEDKSKVNWEDLLPRDNLQKLSR